MVVDDWEAETRFSPEIGLSVGPAQRRLRGGRRRRRAVRGPDGGRRPPGTLRRGGHRLPTEPRQPAGRGRSTAAGRRERIAELSALARPARRAGARRRGARPALDVREHPRRRAAGHPARRPRPVGARRRAGRRGRPRHAAGRRRAPARGHARPPPHRARVRRPRGGAARRRRPSRRPPAASRSRSRWSPRPSASATSCVLSVARELLTNAARHARAVPRAPDAAARPAARSCSRSSTTAAGWPLGREREALAEGHIGLAISAERVAAVGGAAGARAAARRRHPRARRAAADVRPLTFRPCAGAALRRTGEDGCVPIRQDPAWVTDGSATALAQDARLHRRRP